MQDDQVKSRRWRDGLPSTAIPMTDADNPTSLVEKLANNPLWVALLLGLLLLMGAGIADERAEREGSEAIWRNTEHTAEMMDSLLKDQVEEAADKLRLLIETYVNDVPLLTAINQKDPRAFDLRAKQLMDLSFLFVTGLHIYDADGKLKYTQHSGSLQYYTQAVGQSRTSAETARSVEIHDDGDIHVHVARPIFKNGHIVGFINLTATLNARLDSINNLLRLETEQHAEHGRRGDTAIGIFIEPETLSEPARLVAKAGNFPLEALTLLSSQIRRSADRGETERHHFSIVPFEDGHGGKLAAAVLALDTQTAKEAHQRHTHRNYLLMNVGALLITLLAYVLLQRIAHHNHERNDRLERMVDARTEALRAAEARLIEQNINLEQQVVDRTARLAKALADAEAATRAKSVFLANMSHEIRTPMNAVIGLSGLCLQEPLGEKARNYVAKTHASAQHLLGVINDILDISKIEAGKLRVERIAFNLDEVIQSINNVCGVAAAAKHLTFTIAIAPETPHRIKGDPLRLTQVLNNLLSNAIKFTEQGTVTLTIAPREGDGELRLLFDVSDTGIGLSEPQLVSLFKPFVQADDSSTRKFGGTGLGLVISQTLVELMGGKIAVTSEPGRGSTFSFSLKMIEPESAILSRPDAAVAPPLSRTLPKPPDLSGCRILLVEDNEFNQLVASDYLKLTGAEVVIASNGQEAVDAAHQGRWGLVLMDVQMPVMDGYSATRIIREHIPAGKLPIIAMTAHALAEERQRCLDAGMDDFISKPFDPPGLYRMLERWIRRDVDVATSPVIAAVSEAKVESETPVDAFDPDFAMRYAQDDPVKLHKMLDTFYHRIHDLPERLREKADSGEADEVRRIAHTLKGSAPYVGANTMSKRAAVLEKAAEATTPGWQAMSHELAEAVSRLAGNVSNYLKR